MSTDPSRTARGDDSIARPRVLVLTGVVILLTVVTSHMGIGVLHYLHNRNPNGSATFAWHPIVGTALAVVPVVSFVGLYVAVGRARVAIAAAFVLTFLTMLPFALTIPDIFAEANNEMTGMLVRQFTTVVMTVVAFYFGSEAVVAAAKVWRVSDNAGSTTADIKAADEEFASGPRRGVQGLTSGPAAAHTAENEVQAER